MATSPQHVLLDLRRLERERSSFVFLFFKSLFFGKQYTDAARADLQVGGRWEVRGGRWEVGGGRWEVRGESAAGRTLP